MNKTYYVRKHNSKCDGVIVDIVNINLAPNKIFSRKHIYFKDEDGQPYTIDNLIYITYKIDHKRNKATAIFVYKPNTIKLIALRELFTQNEQLSHVVDIGKYIYKEHADDDLRRLAKNAIEDIERYTKINPYNINKEK